MKKRLLSLVLAAGMVGTLFAGCSSSSSSAAQSGAADSNKPVTISIFMGSPEITKAVNTAINEYKKVKPNVTIQLQVLQSDLNTVLKSKIASGSVPDVFQTTNGPELQTYDEYSADLTNEPAAKALIKTVRESMTYNKKVEGLPLKVDDFGIIYNKDMFEQAGVTETPKTLADLESAATKLKAKGYQPFTNGFKEWWEYKHIMQHFIAAADSNVSDITDKFVAGKAKFSDYPVMSNYFKFIDIATKYGDAKPLETDYNAQVSAVGSGKAAMATGVGSFAEANILKVDSKLKLSIMPYPVSDDASKANLVAGAGQCLRVSSKSDHLNAIKDFMNWWFTSDYAVKTWFPEVAQLVAPMTNAESPKGLTIPNTFTELQSKDKVPCYDSAINYSDDSYHQKLGEIMQAYVAKTKTQDQCIKDIQNAWKQYGKPQA